MIIGLPIIDTEQFNHAICHIGLDTVILGPFLSDFYTAYYSCGSLNVETITQLKITFPSLKVIDHAKVYTNL